MIEKELYQIIFEFFGYKCKMQNFDAEKIEICFILYDTFLFKCNLKGNGCRFNCRLIIGDDTASLAEFLGKHCLPDCDLKSIKSSLAMVDEYCRMRLPDKFLEAYYKAYAPDPFKDK